MHKAILRLLLGSLLLTIITATAPPRCQAADNATSEPAKEKKHPRIPFRGKITSVDKNAMTLTLEGKEKNRTIHVTSHCRKLCRESLSAPGKNQAFRQSCRQSISTKFKKDLFWDKPC